MNVLASEKQERSTVSALAGESIIRPAAVSSITSIVCTTLVALCFSLLVVESEAEETQNATTLPILASGKYQGIWRDENGKSNALLADFDIDGQSIKGKLTLTGVKDYSGDRIRGEIEQNADGTLAVEFKTRDGKWKTKAVFDGQALVGTYMYEFQDRRVQRLVKGEWAAQRIAD